MPFGAALIPEIGILLAGYIALRALEFLSSPKAAKGFGPVVLNIIAIALLIWCLFVIADLLFRLGAGGTGTAPG